MRAFFLLALDRARLAIAPRRRRWPSDAEHSEKRVVEKCRLQTAQGNKTGEVLSMSTRREISKVWVIWVTRLCQLAGTSWTLDILSSARALTKLHGCKFI